MKKVFFSLLMGVSATLFAQKQPVEYVNPFIGTSNYGTTNPGAICPNGLMSVVPFNVMGSDLNKFDKDKQWWSTPYSSDNSVFTGFSHVNLSGVGCPDLGSLLLMPTTGALNVDFKEYGSEYRNEAAKPGYYTNFLTKYNIRTEATASQRVGLSRFTFPAGQGNILLNLGEGLTNESGATVRIVNDTEIEGSKLLGTFCYNPDAVFPIYFVMKVNKAPKKMGYWKKQREMSGVEADWDTTAGKYKIYSKYTREMSGDNVGVWFEYDTEKDEQIEVKMGVSFVSIENARENMNVEQPNWNFDEVYNQARTAWNNDLSRINIEGGSMDQKIVFYTALYHMLIHPNILQDVNGEYPAMGSLKTMNTTGNRYTVFSLWDTYRNVHQFLSLVYPEKQIEMVRTMIDMYKESGWLPKWELFGQETLTMEGDPSLIVIADTWRRGLRDFDLETAYEAMVKSATLPQAENLMRPDADDYYEKGYVPLRSQYDNSVSHALEYYIADWNLAKLAEEMGRKEEAKIFYKRAMGYKNYFSKEYGTLRPILPNGEFYTPFDPLQGLNFEPSPGFHEGNAWNYTFAVPHDVMGLAKLMGGKKNFVDKLQMVFDKDYFDMTNEPDIAYPYLFSYFKGEQWRTQKLVRELLAKYFTNKPAGLPGNDDTGTMSAWAAFSMMGFYPTCPGDMNYTLTSPVFDKVTIKLDPKYYGKDSIVITANNPENVYIKEIKLNGKKHNSYFISHKELVNSANLFFELEKNHK